MRTPPTLTVLVLALAVSGDAGAYTIETHFTARCHEKLAAEALRAARPLLELPATPAASGDERALIDDLQFVPDADMADLAGATLLVAVRDNDLKGNSQEDLTVLSAIHGDPANQREHCLRGPDQKEPGGSAAAIADCQAFIRERAAEAIDGLDAAGIPDFSKRVALPLYLSLRGHVDALLPAYYVRIGQAMHAVQDSFTHTYRTADGKQITVALDWLDSVNGTLVESVSGPAHATALDACDDADLLRTTRRALAVEASTALLAATLAPHATRDEKLAAVDRMLTAYVSYTPGCTFANGWCDAPERAYKDSKNVFGCGTAGGLAWCWIGLFALVAGRRRRIALVLAVVALAGTAQAVEPSATSTTKTTPAKPATPTANAVPATVTTTTITVTSADPDTHAPPAPNIVAVEEPGPRDPSKTAWGGYLGTAGSIDKTAAAIQAGMRLKVSNHWTFGLDAEWNPWITLNGNKIGSGVFNLYGAAILRFPLAYENFNLRATANLGTSVLLMNLYGAPAGSMGVFAAISPAGLEWKVSRKFMLILNPLSVALPVPQIHGVPLTYPQYRVGIGVEIQSG